MKKQIEQVLQVLIGLTLWGSGRAGIQWFHFGERRLTPVRAGGVKEVGEYALHVECAWRIRNSSKIIAGSRDRNYPVGDPYQGLQNADVDESKKTRLDAQMAAFLANGADVPLVVKKVSADAVGGLRLTLSGGYLLEVFPDDSLDGEFWRFFKPGSEESHFVVSGQGIETA